MLIRPVEERDNKKLIELKKKRGKGRSSGLLPRGMIIFFERISLLIQLFTWQRMKKKVKFWGLWGLVR